MNKLITLDDYVKSKGITMQKFQNITGISYSQLAKIKNTVNPTVSIETIERVYNGTKQEFGDGLTCWQWLELPRFWEK